MDKDVKEFLLLVAALLTLAAGFDASAGAPRYRIDSDGDAAPDVITIASAACPTGTPGTSADGIAPGISLSGLVGWKAVLCAEPGQTISNPVAGSLKLCTYVPAPWGPGAWIEAPQFTRAMSTIGGAGKQCILLSDTELIVGLSDRIFLYPSTDFGVTGGTTLTVRLYGETR